MGTLIPRLTSETFEGHEVKNPTIMLDIDRAKAAALGLDIEPWSTSGR